MINLQKKNFLLISKIILFIILSFFIIKNNNLVIASTEKNNQDIVSDNKEENDKKKKDISNYFELYKTLENLSSEERNRIIEMLSNTKIIKKIEEKIEKQKKRNRCIIIFKKSDNK
ncbi:SVM family protein [Candidatus Phytoplasma oryzae]|nr:SVM family protein [Candidatus Phytoplasma oryzae]